MNALTPTAPGLPSLKEGPVLLYDGECGVCSRSVQWILEHENSTSLRFASLQSDVGRGLRAEAQIPDGIDSLLWVEEENGVTRARKWSSSVVSALLYVGGPWRVVAWFRFIPRPIRDFGYRLFAKHRQKFAPTTCLIPAPETRTRFLDSVQIPGV